MANCMHINRANRYLMDSYDEHATGFLSDFSTSTIAHKQKSNRIDSDLIFRKIRSHYYWSVLAC